MAGAELDPPIADKVPWSETLTEYDQQHFVVYLRLLDADEEGASHVEMAWMILGMEPNEQPERALAAVESHLERARWVAEHGFLDLLK